MKSSEIYRKEALEFHVAPDNRIHALTLPPVWLLCGLMASICALLFLLGLILIRPLDHSVLTALIPDKDSSVSSTEEKAILVSSSDFTSGLRAGTQLCTQLNGTPVVLTVLSLPISFRGSPADLPPALLSHPHSFSQVQVRLKCTGCWQRVPIIVHTLNSDRSFFEMIRAGRSQRLPEGCRR